MADVDSLRPSGPFRVKGPIVVRDIDGKQIDLTGKTPRRPPTSPVLLAPGVGFA